MMAINVSVFPTDDEEAAMVLSMFTSMVQSLAFKGVSVSLSVNQLDEEETEESQT